MSAETDYDITYPTATPPSGTAEQDTPSSITCTRCGNTSYHELDIRTRYCGNSTCGFHPISVHGRPVAGVYNLSTQLAARQDHPAFVSMRACLDNLRASYDSINAFIRTNRSALQQYYTTGVRGAREEVAVRFMSECDSILASYQTNSAGLYRLLDAPATEVNDRAQDFWEVRVTEAVAELINQVRARFITVVDRIRASTFGIVPVTAASVDALAAGLGVTTPADSIAGFVAASDGEIREAIANGWDGDGPLIGAAVIRTESEEEVEEFEIEREEVDPVTFQPVGPLVPAGRQPRGLDLESDDVREPEPGLIVSGSLFDRLDTCAAFQPVVAKSVDVSIPPQRDTVELKLTYQLQAVHLEIKEILTTFRKEGHVDELIFISLVAQLEVQLKVAAELMVQSAVAELNMRIEHTMKDVCLDLPIRLVEQNCK